MKDNILLSLSKSLAVRIITITKNNNDFRINAVMNQILRSGTSIGANIHEANYASSKADFINKLQIALKECFETSYWLDLLVSTEIITQDDYSILYNENCKIRRLLIASINTAKANIDKK